jgi:FtsP/CotA-like multicopper oxidase with cupredoxin domain
MTLFVLVLFWPAALIAADCPRPFPGSLVAQPGEIRSSGGALKVDLSFRSVVDAYGLKRYCYMSDGLIQAPTLRLQAGDELVLTLKNDLLPSGAHVHSETQPACAGNQMTDASTNLHFHGLSVPPTCHQDDTLHTLVSPADSPFEYRIKLPADQSPGLYWYHPHPHGFTEEQVLGGASGALIVEGIERVRPEVAGLPERVMILRDQRIPGVAESDEDSGPGKDISVNFVPVLFPLYRPAEMAVRPGEREFWRVVNASADTYFDLEVRYGPTIQDVIDPQPLELVALDGAAVGAAVSKTSHILVAPGARAEFIATMPPLGVFAQLVSLKYDTGPDGETSPYRVIANIRSRKDAPASGSAMPGSSASPRAFVGLEGVAPARQRKLYFSEDRQDLKDPNQQAKYFITVDGETPKPFDMNFSKPDITVRQGTVEDWIIENRAREAHNFHIHQLHFQLLERDGKKVNEPALRDTIDLPYWDGVSAEYPSVKLRMDFRGSEIVGTFVYHCHILEHEDAGMMGSIEVLPADTPNIH